VTEDTAINLGVDAVILALKIAMPILMVGLVVGFAISIFQAITQIQEMTLTFIPKILAMVVVMIVAGPWMLDQLLGYTHDLWVSIPEKAGP
jgi:flagellar biosynthetic protein FliQ